MKRCDRNYQVRIAVHPDCRASVVEKLAHGDTGSSTPRHKLCVRLINSVRQSAHTASRALRMTTLWED